MQKIFNVLVILSLCFLFLKTSQNRESVEYDRDWLNNVKAVGWDCEIDCLKERVKEIEKHQYNEDLFKENIEKQIKELTWLI